MKNKLVGLLVCGLMASTSAWAIECHDAIVGLNTAQSFATLKDQLENAKGQLNEAQKLSQAVGQAGQLSGDFGNISSLLSTRSGASSLPRQFDRLPDGLRPSFGSLQSGRDFYRKLATLSPDNRTVVSSGEINKRRLDEVVSAAINAQALAANTLQNEPQVLADAQQLVTDTAAAPDLMTRQAIANKGIAQLVAQQAVTNALLAHLAELAGWQELRKHPAAVLDEMTTENGKPFGRVQ